MKKRKSNNPEGRPPTANGEDQQAVRGPRELLERMRAEAKRLGIPVAALWRRAAELILTRPA